MGQEDARVLMDKTAIRDAATIIVLRDRATRPRVLMGQRGKGAAFMPSKFVFPGGAVDSVDATIPWARPPSEACTSRLALETDTPAAAVLAAATRELWEETGLLLGAPDPRAGTIEAPKGWRGYLATGHLPDGGALEFVFRAITPPGRPRRFDARFLLAEAETLANDPDDFSRAEDELSHLQWVPLDEVRTYDMPFITEVVLAELSARLTGTAHPGVPFFDNSTEISRFRRL
ncbi:NTP pyrophosphohydrolase [Roseibacterium elongatum DSM 19469]|uniref:NTP pyrophosphohydrolase n=1 Tax=Roseicyclus elongatus DSM 19469 TaxID=1294273 RepID=W8SJ46_9RHOB|nr:NUDIX hydrolase [Roseibacterium elongatum]AHM02510.1 NTP pyrophosphohydrolase [Roseibacterium elongatum DSM 19469]